MACVARLFKKLFSGKEPTAFPLLKLPAEIREMIYREVFESCRAERDYAPILVINGYVMTATSLNPFVSLLRTCRLVHAEAAHLLADEVPVIAHWCQRAAVAPRFAQTFPMYCNCAFPPREAAGWRVPASRRAPPMHTPWPHVVALYKWRRQPAMPLSALAGARQLAVELSWGAENRFAVGRVVALLRALADRGREPPTERPRRLPPRTIAVTVHFSTVPSAALCQLDSWHFFHGCRDVGGGSVRHLAPLRSLLGRLHADGKLEWGLTAGLFYAKGTSRERMRAAGPWPMCDVDEGAAPPPVQLRSESARCGMCIRPELPVIYWSVRAERAAGGA